MHHDLYQETLEKKITRLEKWITRLQREMWFLKETYVRTNPRDSLKVRKKVEQLTFFGT